MPTCPAGHDSASTDFCDVCGIRLAAPAQPSTAARPAGSAVPAASPGAPAPPGSPGGPPAAAAPSASPAPPGSASAIPGAAAAPPAGQGAPQGEPCPQCGAARSGQFCEVCGYSFASGPARVATAPSYLSPSAGHPPAVPGNVPAGPAAAAAGGAWTAVVTADRAYFDSVVAAGGPDAAGLEFPAYCPERRFRLQGPEMRIGRRSASRGLEPEIDLTGPPADPGVSHLHAVLVAETDGGWAVLDPGSANGTQVNGNEIAAGARVRLRDGDRVCVGAWTVLSVRAA
jgi:hypothetical protein